MSTSNAIKVTVVGGEKNGFEMEFDCTKPVLVGRSRSADLHLPEADVSGKHFELVKTDVGCMVRVMSRNGLVVDGRVLNSGDTAYVQVGSVIGAGVRAKIRVDALWTDGSPSLSVGNTSCDDGAISSADAIPSVDATAPVEAAVSADAGVTADFQNPTDAAAAVGEAGVTLENKNGDLDAETAPDSMADPPAPVPDENEQQFDVGGNDAQANGSHLTTGGADFTNDDTNADIDESATSAGEDGETQEMKTRVGSLEEIVERKRQLDRTRTYRRMRISIMIGVLIASLAGVWIFLNWNSNAIDVNGPYLPNGEADDVDDVTLLGETGEPEFYLIYPRNNAMKVSISADSNSVEVASWFGKKSDVPFHMEFLRWNDRADLQRSLEGSFERWMLDETAKGSAFETQGGNRPTGRFLENVYPGFLETRTLRGVRFVSAEYTRSRNRELWHGNCIYFRKGDRIHALRLEIPDLFWKIAQHRVMRELHLGVYASFMNDHWDSPGTSGLVDSNLSDDELIARIRRELSAERVAAWPDLAAYIDTLLVRSWGDKPRIQKEAMSFYMTMQDHMAKFYSERELAFVTARANGDEKRMKGILIDCMTAFGPMSRDRRSTMVNNPEVWSCRQRR